MLVDEMVEEKVPMDSMLVDEMVGEKMPMDSMLVDETPVDRMLVDMTYDSATFTTPLTAADSSLYVTVPLMAHFKQGDAARYHTVQHIDPVILQ